MSALGQKRTFAPQKSCLLYPRKRTCAAQLGMSALGQKRKLLPDEHCRLMPKLTRAAVCQVLGRQILIAGIILQAVDRRCDRRPRIWSPLALRLHWQGFLSCANSKSLRLHRTSFIRPAPNAARRCGSRASSRTSRGSRNALLNVRPVKTRPSNSSNTDRPSFGPALGIRFLRASGMLAR
jgi:hypothetical protein